MIYLLKGAGNDSWSLEDWSKRSAQHTRSGLSWQHCKLEWQEAASCLQRHARQPCCAETIKMHLQNEVLCFIAIVCQGMKLLLSQRWKPGLGSMHSWQLPFCGTSPVQSHSGISFPVSLCEGQAEKQVQTQNQGIWPVFQFPLEHRWLPFPLASSQKDNNHPSNQFISYLMSMVPRVLFWDT